MGEPSAGGSGLRGGSGGIANVAIVELTLAWCARARGCAVVSLARLSIALVRRIEAESTSDESQLSLKLSLVPVSLNWRYETKSDLSHVQISPS